MSTGDDDMVDEDVETATNNVAAGYSPLSARMVQVRTPDIQFPNATNTTIITIMVTLI